MIGMEEIGLARLEQFGAIAVLHRLHVVPAHMRHLDRRIGALDQPDIAGDPAEARAFAIFEPARGEQLHADADAEERHAVRQHALFQRLDQARRSRSALQRRCWNDADAGQHDPLRAAHEVGIRRHRHMLARPPRSSALWTEWRLPAP